MLHYMVIVFSTGKIFKYERPAKAFGIGSIASIAHELEEFCIRDSKLVDIEWVDRYIACWAFAISGKSDITVGSHRERFPTKTNHSLDPFVSL
ncbi:hypothetical protein GCM10008985_34710 [Halococcus dombrowskii]|uniref:Uncharacterized protein n=1 Tax=Halococcus dombrowskii TaxID=179637 RepID=A0AAV3SLM6_HALDO